ncbi:MAG: hypothetical protein FWG87_05900 [Defluviitaleaceae bacterium]|nr:hypothetical protein [Defluviitaleaceae bacterium]
MSEHIKGAIAGAVITGIFSLIGVYLTYFLTIGSSRKQLEQLQQELQMLQVAHNENIEKTNNLVTENMYLNTQYENATNEIARMESIYKTAIPTERYDYISPYLDGEVTFDYSNNDGYYTIGTGEYEFKTSWSKSSNTSIYARRRSSIYAIAHWRNSGDISILPNVQEYDFTSINRNAEIGDSIIWINEYGNIAITKIESVKDSSRYEGNDELTFSYIIFK